MISGKIKLIIDSDVSDVFLIGLSVNRICLEIPVSEIEAYQIEVCVVEAVNNTIKHAYGSEKGHEVEVLMDVNEERIAFHIRDTGRTMKTGEKPTLEFDPEDRENFPEGGMGLFIMHQVMDEVKYSSSRGRNVLLLSKHFVRKGRRNGQDALTAK